MVDSRNIFDHARLHPSMEIILVLTEWPPFGTHFCHAVSILKEITMYNQVKTIQRILLITKLIVRIYFMKGMMILTILWITKLMVRIWLEGQIAFSIWYIHTIFHITFYVGIIEINQGEWPKRHSHLQRPPVPI